MICKSCGTQCKGEFCPHCGESLVSYVVTVPSCTAISVEPAKKVHRPALSVKMVFWQSIALLLPLAYLFFDTFVVFCDALFQSSASGSMQLHQFMERLMGLSYETNTVGEIMELTMGESITAFETVSPLFWLFTAPVSEFLLPTLAIVLFVLLCAVASVLLLVTGGRILRMRAFMNLTLIAGAGATFAPLLGMLLLRVQYFFNGGFAAADMQIQHITVSLEAICIMGVLMCALLPSLASLRKVAAYAEKKRDFVCFPYCFLTKRSFAFSKIIAALSMIAFLALTVCFFFFPITTTAERNLDTVLQNIVGDWNAGVTVIKGLFVKDNATSVMEKARAVMHFAYNIWMLLVLIGALLALIDLFRVLFIKRDALQKKKKNQKKVKKYSKALFHTVFAPFVTFFVLQVLLCSVFLFFTSVAMHLNFANANETLSIVYLTISYVRTLGMTNTLYAFFCVGGLLLWYTADQTTAALIVQAG